MPDQIDALGIDRERCLDLVDDAGQIGAVVDVGSMKVLRTVKVGTRPWGVAVVP